MIIDNHVHVFPDQAGPAGYKDEAAYRAELQKIVRPSWGRMYSSHEDPKYIAEAGEDVEFRVGRFNRFQWKKHGEDVWLQRGAVSMEKMEYTPDQLIANMDFIGVDKGVVLAGYMEHSWGREVYFADAIREHPDRLIGTVAIEYDVTRDEKYLRGEIEKLTRAVEENGFRALHTHVIKGQPVDDPKCDPLWKECLRLGIPVYMDTGFNGREAYLEEIDHIRNVLQKYPDMHVIDCHLGAWVKHPSHPEYVDNPREFFPLFKLGNFHLEMGYVLAYENWGIWGKEFEYPYPRHEQIIRTVYENFGPEAMVWGSDMPWALRTCTYQQNLDLIRLHCDFMTPEDRALVMGGNLQKLLRVE